MVSCWEGEEWYMASQEHQAGKQQVLISACSVALLSQCPSFSSFILG